MTHTQQRPGAVETWEYFPERIKPDRLTPELMNQRSADGWELANSFPLSILGGLGTALGGTQGQTTAIQLIWRRRR